MSSYPTFLLAENIFLNASFVLQWSKSFWYMLIFIFCQTPHPYLGHPSISKKKCAIKSMLFSISRRKTKSPCEKKFFVTFGTCEKIEVKRGHLVKKWEFGQKKKILIYQFFKTRICAFMTYGQFPPKSSSNLRFVIRDSRVRDPQLRPREGLEPLNLGWQISDWSLFWWIIKLAINFEKGS